MLEWQRVVLDQLLRCDVGGEVVAIEGGSTEGAACARLPCASADTPRGDRAHPFRVVTNEVLWRRNEPQVPLALGVIIALKPQDVACTVAATQQRIFATKIRSDTGESERRPRSGCCLEALPSEGTSCPLPQSGWRKGFRSGDLRQLPSVPRKLATAGIYRFRSRKGVAEKKRGEGSVPHQQMLCGLSGPEY